MTDYNASCVICDRDATPKTDFCEECRERGCNEDNFGRCYVCRDFQDHEDCIGVPCQCPCPAPDEIRKRQEQDAALAKLTPRERQILGYSSRAIEQDRRIQQLEAELTTANVRMAEYKREFCAPTDAGELARLRRYLTDTCEDMECLEKCDSYGHEELCPVTNTVAAFRQLRAELTTAREQLERQDDAVNKVWTALGGSGCGDDRQVWEVVKQQRVHLEESRAQLAEKEREIAVANQRFRAFATWIIGYASEMHAKWDADEDSRVGKMIKALRGQLPGYRSDVDLFHRTQQEALNSFADKQALTPPEKEQG